MKPSELVGIRSEMIADNKVVSVDNPYSAQLNHMIAAMYRGEAIDGEAWQQLDELKRRYDQLKAQEESEHVAAKKMPTAKLGERVPARSGDEARPKCRKHNRFMKYNPAEDRMECVENGCAVTARKRRTFRDSVGAEVTESMAVYRGALEFITDQDGELFLFLPDANAAISLMGVREAKPFEDDPETNSRAIQFMKLAASLVTPAAKQAERLKEMERRSRDVEQATRRMKGRQTTVSGTTKLRNVALPPHLSSVKFAGDIERRLDNLLHSGRITRELPIEDQVAYAIESLWPSQTADDSIDYRFYTAQGELLHWIQVEVADVEDKFGVAIEKLLELADDIEHEADLPAYVMLDGYALTEYGCKKLLREFSSPDGRFVDRKKVAYPRKKRHLPASPPPFPGFRTS